MEDFGSALTGQAVEPAQAQGQWDDWLQRPGNRTALLQMGINLMQPVGVGQSPMGQFGQAVGAAGEAVGRQEASDLKERVADAKMQTADERLRIAQQQADAGTLRATSAAAARANRKIGGLTELVKSRYARQDAQNFEKQLDKDAADLVKQANDVLADPNSDVVKQYKGKTKMQIRDELRKTRPQPKYGAVPSSEDDGEEDTTDPAAAVVDTPPVAGAQKAADGNYYVPDPKRPGKFLKVVQ